MKLDERDYYGRIFYEPGDPRGEDNPFFYEARLRALRYCPCVKE
jgi:hypothetical protein